jgi:hypothetical protein
MNPHNELIERLANLAKELPKAYLLVDWNSEQLKLAVQTITEAAIALQQPTAPSLDGRTPREDSARLDAIERWGQGPVRNPHGAFYQTVYSNGPNFGNMAVYSSSTARGAIDAARGGAK